MIKNYPIFYPSVSSVAKNRLTVLEHIEILSALKYPSLLISAFDIFHLNTIEKEKLQAILKTFESKQVNLIIDSGMYEKVWSQNDSWSYEQYKNVVKNLSYNFVFNFDEYINPKDLPTDEIIKSINQKDIKNLAPILHTKNSADLPELCYQIAKLDTVDVIAIPERELGNGILEGIQTVSKIKQKLLQLDKYKKIHILGTGNPLSILIYSAFGIDSFDGLDWCQTVVDFESATLYHSLQLDFFAHQSKFGELKEVSYITRLFAHNLEFYIDWMKNINLEIQNDSMDEMLKFYLPKSISNIIVQLYGEYHAATN